MDSAIMAGQKPTATLSSRHDNHSNDQDSVSSAPGHGVEESKEEALDKDISASIKSLVMQVNPHLSRLLGLDMI